VSEINTFSIFARITTTTMIQRIQSVYFALAAIFSGLMFAFPFYSVQVLTETVSFRLTSGVAYGLVLNMLAGATIGLPLATIFQFKNRKLQIMLARVNQLLLAGLLVACVLSFDAARSTAADAASVAPAMFFPIGGILFTILAMRGVKKDEALVRSADRIR
jgi:hypothetical protein